MRQAMRTGSGRLRAAPGLRPLRVITLTVLRQPQEFRRLGTAQYRAFPRRRGGRGANANRDAVNGIRKIAAGGIERRTMKYTR